MSGVCPDAPPPPLPLTPPPSRADMGQPPLRPLPLRPLPASRTPPLLRPWLSPTIPRLAQTCWRPGRPQCGMAVARWTRSHWRHVALTLRACACTSQGACSDDSCTCESESGLLTCTLPLVPRTHSRCPRAQLELPTCRLRRCQWCTRCRPSPCVLPPPTKSSLWTC